MHATEALRLSVWLPVHFKEPSSFIQLFFIRTPLLFSSLLTMRLGRTEGLKERKKERFIHQSVQTQDGEEWRGEQGQRESGGVTCLSLLPCLSPSLLAYLSLLVAFSFLIQFKYRQTD
mmetsp:Transcript_17817/g.36190  ORF Transcript_17817/g.36190 Transcript_17817/m.36190 type:complete len:118 (-) Transcript_17817:1112-1465(-)